MTETNGTNIQKLCRYEEYLQPTVKKSTYDFLHPHHTKKLSHHKHRLSGLLKSCSLNRTAQFNTQAVHKNTNYGVEQAESIQNTGCIHGTGLDETGLDGTGLNATGLNATGLNATLFRKNINPIGKQQGQKLQKLFPKNVTIKFQDVLDSIPNNRSVSKLQNNSKMGRTISPFKVFQMAENKFYLQVMNQHKRRESQKEKQDQYASNKIDELFNVRSIKMIKKLAQSMPKRQQTLNDDGNQVKIQKKKDKYTKMFKNQTDFSVEYEKQNPKLLHQLPRCNVKMSLKDLRKFQLYESRTKDNLKTIKNCPSSQNNQKQIKRLNKHKSSLIDQISDIKNQTIVSINSKNVRRNSKQFTPMIFSLNQDLNSSLLTNGKGLDNKFLIIRKPDSIFQHKINKYINMLKINAQINGIQIKFPETYTRNQCNFFVGEGNNSKLVKYTLKKRWWLGNCEEKKDMNKNNVIWSQLKDRAFYNQTQKQIFLEDSKLSNRRLAIHNHFQQNQFLGNKKALFYNMKAYYQSIGQDVFVYLPLTFHITSLSDGSWQQFLRYFKKSKEQNPTIKNIWILKPGQNSNRGNGITVHQNLQSILSVVCQSQKSGMTYILQKYIQQPFLYNKRKFDIRCYMLLTRLNGKIKGFWYKQGYIRTSGYQFSLDDCQNSFVHLTNDAIQQNCDNYGKYQDKNKLSYEHFQKYLDSNHNTPEKQTKYNFEAQILPKLRKVCIDSIKASYKRLGNWKNQTPTFQLFGLDFMIDQAFNPWLIQINTNPCLQTQGRVLQKVIVPLVDNVFKLSVDCIFPPPLNWSNSNKHLLSKNVDKHLFELVFDENLEEQRVQTRNLTKDYIMQKIGQIDEDNQIYEQDEE